MSTRKPKRKIEECHEPAAKTTEPAKTKTKAKPEKPETPAKPETPKKAPKKKKEKVTKTEQPAETTKPGETKEVEMKDATSTTKEALEPPKKKSKVKNTYHRNFKTKMTKVQFLNEAGNVEVFIDDKPLSMAPKKFRTTSIGWQHIGYMTVTVNGNTFNAFVNLLVTIIHSKNWYEDDEAKTADMRGGRRSGAPSNVHEQDEIKDTNDSTNSGKITIDEFFSTASPLVCTGLAKAFALTPQTMSTGNVGWNYIGKTNVPLKDQVVYSQVTFNVVIPNSKDWKK